MSWLISYTIASMVAAFIVVRLFDLLFAGAVGGVAKAARLSLFVGTWAAVTAGSGMRGFTKRIRGWQQNTRALNKRLAALPKDERR